MTLRKFRSGLLYNLATVAFLGAAGIGHAQSAASTAGGTTPAPAVVDQAPADAGTSELVVTAQRRSESIQNVGIAVTAFTGSQLKALNISSSIELSQLTPGLFISASSAGEDSQFTIRGVTQNDFNEVAESPIAVYIDDTYVPNLRGQALSLFDVQRVEVLKGPQGTLFGRNATGGLIQFVVNKPTSTFEGYGDVTYGSYNQVKVESAVSGPIAPNLFARAAIYYDRYDPINTNHYPEGLVIGAGAANPGYAPYGDNLGNDNTVAGRLQVEYKPTDRLDIRVTGSAAYQNLSSSPYNEIPLTPTFDANGNATNVVTGAKADSFGYVPLKGHDVSTDFARASGNLGHTYDSALHIDYDLGGGVKFTSVSDAKLSSSSIETQVAPGPTNFLGIVQPQTTVSFSQEFRLTGSIDKLNWTTGAYYLDRLTHSELSFTVNPGSVLASAFNSGTAGAFTSSFGRIRDYSFSLFGQGEYAINDQFKIIAGLRGVEEYQSFAYRSEAYLGKGKPVHAHPGTPRSSLWLIPIQIPEQNRSGREKIQLEYRPMDRVLIYGEVNRGVKAGGYNQPSNLFPAVIAASTFAYKPEELIDYEAGLKATRGMFTVDLSAFYYHYENYQAFRFEGLSGTVVNRPATYYGGEADITIRPMKDLTVELQASAVHARVDDVNITPTITATTQPTFTPAGSSRFPDLLPLSHGPVFGGTLDYGVEGHYTDSFYTDLRNFEGQRASGYFLANMHLIWTDASGKFDAAITANNIGNVLYETTAFDVSPVCGCGEIAYGNPRWITGRIGYKF